MANTTDTLPIGEIRNLKVAGSGASGTVLIINPLRVIKTGVKPEDIAPEREAYRIFRKHILRKQMRSPYVLECFDTEHPLGVILERCFQTVRQRLLSSKDGHISNTDIHTWASQAGQGLSFIHDYNIIHADVGCQNMLLNEANILKICDFAGSSVNGSKAIGVYNVWSRLSHKEEPTRMSDLFALGCALYEMSTTHLPYHDKERRDIPELYQTGQFPSLTETGSLQVAIINCWLQKYTTADEVVADLEQEYIAGAQTSVPYRLIL